MLLSFHICFNGGDQLRPFPSLEKRASGQAGKKLLLGGLQALGQGLHIL